MKTEMEHFTSKVKKTDACWLWVGGINPVTGYGNFYWKNTQRGSHRASWEIHNGPIPGGMQINHHCDVRACVNPEHLYLGDQADNMKDVSDRKRGRKPRLRCSKGHDNWGSSGNSRRCKTCSNERQRKDWAKRKLNLSATE
jgi:hypothetical protein